MQGGWRHWTVGYTGTQSFINTFSHSLSYICALLINLDWLFQTSNVQTLQPIIMNQSKDNFV